MCTSALNLIYFWGLSQSGLVLLSSFVFFREAFCPVIYLRLAFAPVLAVYAGVAVAEQLQLVPEDVSGLAGAAIDDGAVFTDTVVGVETGALTVRLHRPRSFFGCRFQHLFDCWFTLLGMNWVVVRETASRKMAEIGRYDGWPLNVAFSLTTYPSRLVTSLVKVFGCFGYCGLVWSQKNTKARVLLIGVLVDRGRPSPSFRTKSRPRILRKSAYVPSRRPRQSELHGLTTFCFEIGHTVE